MKRYEGCLMNEGYILKVDVQYPEILHEIQNYLPFLPEIMKTEKVKNLVTNLYDKTEYIIHIKLKEALNSGLILKKKVQRVIKFNEKACLNSFLM